MDNFRQQLRRRLHPAGVFAGNYLQSDGFCSHKKANFRFVEAEVSALFTTLAATHFLPYSDFLSLQAEDKFSAESQ